jgi:hypothetical protein
VPNASQIREQIASELSRRQRLAVPAFASGVVYLLSTIVIASVLRTAPTVGVLQGLEPILRGESHPLVSPRAAEVKFVSQQTFGLIAGSLLGAVSVIGLTLVVLLLLDAARFRRPQTWAAARPLVLYGGVAVAILGVANHVAIAIQAHSFDVGRDFSNHAVDQVLPSIFVPPQSTVNIVIAYLGLLVGLALSAGIIATALNAQRVGLLPRWMGILGMFAGVIVSPIGQQLFGAELQVVPALWLVMMGLLYIGRWSKGDPPAWEAGEARPWPSPSQQRAERQAAEGSGKPVADVAPEPTRPSSGRAANRRRRKRKARS